MQWINLPQIEREAALETVAKRYEIDTPSVEKEPIWIRKYVALSTPFLLNAHSSKKLSCSMRNFRRQNRVRVA